MPWKSMELVWRAVSLMVHPLGGCSLAVEELAGCGMGSYRTERPVKRIETGWPPTSCASVGGQVWRSHRFERRRAWSATRSVCNSSFRCTRG